MLQSHDQKYWERIGKDYSVFWRSKLKNRLNLKELEFINKYLQKSKSLDVLDIGVGSGRIIENYLKNSKIKDIYGMDWAKSMVYFCKNKFKNDNKVKRIIICDISKKKIPFNKKFDFISAIRVLKYNRNWEEVIGKIIGALDDNGIFVFTMPNKYSFLRLTTPETAIYKVTQKEVEKAINRNGGETVKVTTLSRLPDIFYDVTDNNLYVKWVLLLEKFLSKIFGDVFLGREFFIVVRKN